MSLLVNLIVFLIFVVLIFGAEKFGQFLIGKNDLYLFISSIVFASMLFTVLQISGNKENFFFEVTEAKKCCGGSYMYSSNKERQEMCSKIPKEELSRVCCGKGYTGRPMRVTGVTGDMNEIVNN